MKQEANYSQLLPSSDGPGQPREVQGLLHALLRKAWLIVLLTTAGACLGWWQVQRIPQFYVSKTVVEIEPQEQRPIKLKDEDQRDLRNPEIIQTILENFRNRALMESVSQKLNLPSDSDFLNRKVAEPASLDEVVGILLGGSRASMRGQTRLVDVTFTHRNPAVARKIAAALVQQFLELGSEQRMKTLETQNTVLVQKAAELKTKLEKSEKTMLEYENNMQTVSIAERRELVNAKLEALNSELTGIKGDRLRIEADLAAIRKSSNNVDELQLLASIMEDPEVALARTRLGGAEAEHAQLAQRYREKHPDMIAAKAKVELAKSTLNEAILSAPLRLTSRYNGAVTREQGLQVAIAEQEKEALALDEKLIPYRALQREMESDKALFESVLTRLKESNLSLGIEPVSFRIVEPAIPASPVPTQEFQRIGIMMGGGAILAAVLIAGLYFIDSSLHTVDEAERLIGLPVLSAVPFMEKLKSRHDALEMVQKPDSPVAEAFRGLRSSLSLLGPEAERRIFLVTSAIPGEGKTTVSGNIAIAFAQQGLKTLVIDADLRRPSLTKLFSVTGEIGVSEYITGGELSLVKSGVDNLFILSAGHKAPNPAELLANPRFADLITRMNKEFDRIIIDSAPLNVVSDTFSILNCVHAIILVARHGSTPRKVIRRAQELLERAKVKPAGMVLNCMPKWNGAGYYYYYSYGAKYGREHTYGAGYKKSAANGTNGTNGEHAAHASKAGSEPAAPDARK